MCRALYGYVAVELSIINIRRRYAAINTPLTFTVVELLQVVSINFGLTSDWAVVDIPQVQKLGIY